MSRISLFGNYAGEAARLEPLRPQLRPLLLGHVTVRQSHPGALISDNHNSNEHLNHAFPAFSNILKIALS